MKKFYGNTTNGLLGYRGRISFPEDIERNKDNFKWKENKNQLEGYLWPHVNNKPLSYYKREYYLRLPVGWE